MTCKMISIFEIKDEKFTQVHFFVSFERVVTSDLYQSQLAEMNDDILIYTKHV